MLNDDSQQNIINAINRVIPEKLQLELRIAETYLCMLIISILIVAGWAAAVVAHQKLKLFYAFAFDGIAVGAMLAFITLQVRCFWLRRKVKALAAELDQEYLKLKMPTE